MIRNLPSVSLALWVQLFNTGEQLNPYRPEHNQQLSGSVDPLRSEREGLSFLMPVYTCSVWKATDRRFTTLSEPAVLEQRGEKKRGTGTEEKRDNGSRRKKMGLQGVEESP